MSTDITNATTIQIGTTVSMVQTIGAGPSTQTIQMVNQTENVTYDAYAQGQRKIADSTSGVVITSAAEVIVFSSDQALDLTLTISGTAVTIPATKRFSYSSATPASLSVANSSGSEANVDFVTADAS